MRKVFLLASVLFVCLSLGAASKWKLYVNPGHGGYTSNDRQTAMPAVNGVKLPVGDNGFNSSNCFWESSGNTYRAWGIEYFWNKRVVAEGLAASTSIKLSRYDNTQSGDLTLSTIAAASNSYGGYFMSLHTNAGNASANYMIVMCRSISSSNYAAYSSTSLAMAKSAANWHDYVNMTSETYNTPRGMTDRQFYNGSSLGVLRTNNAPGYLAESWFHDYRPEAFRMCSCGYNYFLAWQLMRAYLENPGLDGVYLYPIIVGDIRDLSKSCGYTSYTTRSRDKYLAINGATVTLRNVNTGGTKTYTTDQFNNGFYTFYDCVPGATYEITVSKSGYKSQTQTITVASEAEGGAKGTQHKLNFDLVEGEDEPVASIAVSPATVEFAEVTVGGTSSQSVTVTGTSLTSAISISSSNTADFSLSATSVAAAGGSFTVKYNPSAAGNHSTTITLKSGTVTKTMVVSGSAKNPPLSLTEAWNFSETSATAPSTGDDWTSSKSKMRNMCYGDGKLYVVNAEDGEINIINAKTGVKLGSLDMTGVDGGTLKVIDVEYLDGKIIACNLAVADKTDALKIYVWDNDNAAPRVILETTNIGGTVRLGDTFNLLGDLNNGTFYFAEGAANTTTKVVKYVVADGEVATEPSVLAVTEDGSDSTGVQFGLSPRVIPEADGRFWCVGQNYYPTLFDTDGLVMASLNAEALGNDNAGNAFKAFTFKGTTYAVATRYEAISDGSGDGTIDPTQAADLATRLKKGRATLVDVTDGWANATKLAEYPAAGLGDTRNTSYSGGVEVSVNGDQGVDLWVLIHNQGIAYYNYGTTVDKTQYPKLYIDDKTAWAPEMILGSTPETKTIEVNGVNLSGEISLTLGCEDGTSASMYSVSVDDTEAYSIAENDGYAKVKVSYVPTEEGTHPATLTISTTGADDVVIALNGTSKPNTYLEDNITELTEVWNYSSNSAGGIPSYLTANVIRDIAYNDGKLYVLLNKAWGTPSVAILDAYTGESKGTLDMTGVSGAIVSLSNLVAVDGKIIGSSAARYEEGGTIDTFKVYQWSDDASAPTVLLEDAAHASVLMGAQMSVSGNLTDGRLWFTNDGTSKVIYYDITGGVVSSTAGTIDLKKADGETAFTSDGERGPAGFCHNADGSFWLDAKGTIPTLFSAEGVQQAQMKSGVLGNYGTALNIFGFGEKTYAAAVDYLGSTVDGTNYSMGNGVMRLIDATGGLENVTSSICNVPTAGLGTGNNADRMSDICQSTRDEGHVLDLWVCVNNQGVAHYSYNGRKTVEQTPVGVEDIAAKAEVKVWVADGMLNVAGVEPVSVSVFSISGSLAAQATGDQAIDISALPAGIYIVAIVDVDGNMYTAKIACK